MLICLGTGKTSTAKKMGAVFYEMGLLATRDVVECSASDLIGEYLGQTAPKTKQLFASALGRVLFIDEADILRHDFYGREAMAEIVGMLTLDRFRNQLVTILAGPEPEISKLMAINPGLVSRFPVVIHFDHLSVAHCFDLLLQCLRARGLDTRALQVSRRDNNALEASFGKLTFLPSWGNARDVQTLAKAIYMRIMGARTSQISLVVHQKIVTDEIMAMAKQRRSQASAETNKKRAYDQSSPEPRSKFVRMST